MEQKVIVIKDIFTYKLPLLTHLILIIYQAVI